LPIGNRLDRNGLLDEAEEQLPAVARTSAIESKRELVQVIVDVRVSWNTVPAVTEVCRPHATHCQSTVRTGHAMVPPQHGHRKPFGQRNRTW